MILTKSVFTEIYGYHRVLRELAYDLQSLETEGITVVNHEYTILLLGIVTMMNLGEWPMVLEVYS